MMSSVTHYLYKLAPTRIDMVRKGPTDRETQVVSEHFGYLKHLTEKGVLFLAGRTLNNDEKTFGICILRVNSEAEAQGIMTNDPAVKHNVMSAKLFPYRIALLNKEAGV